MLLCVLSARRTGKSAADALAPADYLHLRREAAGLDRYEVAARLAESVLRAANDHVGRPLVHDRDDAIGLVRQLETPGIKARHRITIEALAQIIPLDVDVYFQLANEPPGRHPIVCRGCGCSEYDPCNGHDGVCTWITPGVCSRCIDRHIARVEAA